MARLSRIVVLGHPHHVTQRGVRWVDAGGRWSPAFSPALSGATVEKVTDRDLIK
jgi:hypothetical protein